jgi:hypothetical protein
MKAPNASFHQTSGSSSDAETVARIEGKICIAQVSSWFGERLAVAPAKWKPEFKLERCPPLDGAAC